MAALRAVHHKLISCPRGGRSASNAQSPRKCSLKGKYRHLRADGEIGPTLPFIENCIRSEIVLDGGNVVKWSDRVILTEKALAENIGWGQKGLVAELERLLDVEQVILIPPEPGDVTGHSDGVVRFVDNGTVVVNDYRQIDRNYRQAVLRRLKDAGLIVLELPYRPASSSSAGMPSAVGNYVNFLTVRRLIVLPIYGFPEDGDAREVLARTNQASSVVTLDCRELASDGGVLNCASWSLKTEF